MGNISAYLHRRAENWVSVFVLIGCVAIAGVLVFVAIQAQALGSRFSETSATNYSIDSI